MVARDQKIDKHPTREIPAVEMHDFTALRGTNAVWRRLLLDVSLSSPPAQHPLDGVGLVWFILRSEVVVSLHCGSGDIHPLVIRGSFPANATRFNASSSGISLRPRLRRWSYNTAPLHPPRHSTGRTLLCNEPTDPISQDKEQDRRVRNLLSHTQTTSSSSLPTHPLALASIHRHPSSVRVLARLVSSPPSQRVSPPLTKDQTSKTPHHTTPSAPPALLLAPAPPPRTACPTLVKASRTPASTHRSYTSTAAETSA